MTDNVVEVVDLNFSYGKRLVLDGLNLNVPRGHITCLMGQNGCGKTTLIDVITGVNRFKSGKVLLNGCDITKMRPAEIAKNAAYVPQLHTVTFPYTVRDMVLMGRTAYSGVFGGPKKEDERIAEEAMAKTGILAYADRPYSNLSGGEIKLVLLARALGQSAELIVMDEPTAHLDLRNELKFLEISAEIVRNEKKTILISTHSPSHAFLFERLGADTRAALMKQGRIYACGSPEEVITGESVSDVFGVNAEIVEYTASDGTREKTICLKDTAK